MIARMKQLREDRGWSTYTLAAKATELGCSMSHTNLWRCENQGRRLPVDEFVALAQALGVAPMDLLSDQPLRVAVHVGVE